MRYQFQHGERVYEVNVQPDGEGITASVDGQAFAVEVLDSQPGVLSLRLDGKPFTLYWAVDGGVKWVSIGGCTYKLEKPAPRRAQAATESSGEAVRAPMPAQVRAVQVAAGDHVEKGQTLLLLEAMKMEIRIKAPSAGVVSKLNATQGQQVEKDQLLAEIMQVDNEKALRD